MVVLLGLPLWCSCVKHFSGCSFEADERMCEEVVYPDLNFRNEDECVDWWISSQIDLIHQKQ